MPRRVTTLLLPLAFALAGCGTPAAPGPAEARPDPVAAARAKLDADDRALVAAQEWCAVSTDERLGSMGTPLKITVKGEPVFLCCEGCTRKAEADPDATLATVAALKAKAKAKPPAP